MAAKCYVVTFSGSSQNLATALGITIGGADDIPFKQLIFEADSANGAVCYVGGAGQTISSTNYGFSFSISPPRDTRVSIGPFDSGSVKLSGFAVLGTLNQKLAVLGVAY